MTLQKVQQITPAGGDGVLRLVQVTDTHLKADRGGTLLGMDTDRSLAAVLELVRSENPEFDVLLATGDLADGGASAAYVRLRDSLDAITGNHYWLPGNHDDRSAMETVVDPAHLSRVLRIGNWQIVMLDSQIPGEVGGELGSAELALLESALEEGSDLNTLICLHHQPVSIGCVWLDQQMVADASSLFSVIGRYPRVRGLLWGHVHQSQDREESGLRLMCSPSTCVQFKPGQTDFALDDVAPGYRWLELYPDGRIHSGVSRVTGMDFQVDLDSRGYL